MDRCAACNFDARESSSRAPICALTGQDNVPDGVSCQPDSGVRVKQERVPGTFNGLATRMRNRLLFCGTESWGMFVSSAQLSHTDRYTVARDPLRSLLCSDAETAL